MRLISEKLLIITPENKHDSFYCDLDFVQILCFKTIVVNCLAGAHEHVVRYFTAWFESDYCYIQTELCDGTLTQSRNSDSGVSLEASLLEIMRQVRITATS